jgi:hypothetical protein
MTGVEPREPGLGQRPSEAKGVTPFMPSATLPAMTQTKTVRATKVRADATVTVDLDEEAADAMSYARDYLVALPRLVREVEAAADDVLGSAG